MIVPDGQKFGWRSLCPSLSSTERQNEEHIEREDFRRTTMSAPTIFGWTASEICLAVTFGPMREMNDLDRRSRGTTGTSWFISESVPIKIGLWRGSARRRFVGFEPVGESHHLVNRRTGA